MKFTTVANKHTILIGIKSSVLKNCLKFIHVHAEAVLLAHQFFDVESFFSWTAELTGECTCHFLNKNVVAKFKGCMKDFNPWLLFWKSVHTFA